LSKDEIRTQNTTLEAEHKRIKCIEAGEEEEETPLAPLLNLALSTSGCQNAASVSTMRRDATGMACREREWKRGLRE
jgi:hypothetical protein